MKRSTLRILALLMMLVMVLAACTSGKEAGDTSAQTKAPAVQKSADSTAKEEAQAPDKVFDKHVTITVNNRNAEVLGADALWDFFSEKFNTTIEPIPMSFNERHEKARIWVSSGDMPDLLWMDLDEKMFAEYANWVRQGMFRAYPSIEDLRSDYPNLAANYDLPNNQNDELMTIDGKQYAHPGYRGALDKPYMSGMGWTYRADWAEKLDMRKDGDIYTWEEWIDLVRAFIDKDPGGNGTGKTIGMGTEIFYFPHAFGVYQTSAEYGFGAFSPKDGKYVWTAARPETLDGLKEVKRLWDAGIIWQDNPLGLAPTDQYTAGLMGVIFNFPGIGGLQNMRNALKENFPDIDARLATTAANVIGPEGTLWLKQSQNYWGGVVMSKNISDDQMNRWLAMLDWLLTEEGYLFRKYGLPDVDYVKAADGTVTCLWPEDPANPGLQMDPYPKNVRDFYMYSTSDIDESILRSPNYSQAAIDDWLGKMDFLYTNGFVRTFDFKSSYLSAPHKDQSGNFITEVTDKMVELITTATADELPGLWTAWIESMNPKVQPVLDELNSMIDDIPVEKPPRTVEETLGITNWK